ncbi:MAG TPA: trimeric intracellular cation channel family protein [Acetobacteraceae bacterium]|nr:trimeric intracellular cation channel family protein [Acetobacteraceae bacterium]
MAGPSVLMACLDGAGTFVFALSGAVLAIRKQFDIFGVLFLSWVVGVVGGITRDVLIGAVPPATIANWHDFAIAIGGGLLTFFAYPVVQSLSRPVLVLDALGLGLFAVTGAQKAISYGVNPVMVAVLGMVSGIGGGMTRDVLAREIPFVLREDLYAVAALAAGAIVSLGNMLGLPPLWSMLVGAAVCILIRMMAIFFGWRAPVARWIRSPDRGG